MSIQRGLSIVFERKPELRLEGLTHKVLQWYLCRMEGWFVADSDAISLNGWDQNVESVACKYGVSKSDLLDREANDLPLHIALGETQALNYLEMISQVVFLEPAEAKAAFRGLAYKRTKDAPLYLEWAHSYVLSDNEMNSGISEKDVKRLTLEQNVHHGNGKQEIFEKKNQ
ncbi:hypothetical protein RYX36_011892 [Vicia faba]